MDKFLSGLTHGGCADKMLNVKIYCENKHEQGFMNNNELLFVVSPIPKRFPNV